MTPIDLIQSSQRRLSSTLDALSDRSVAEILLREHAVTEDALRKARSVQDTGGTTTLLGVLLRSGALPEHATIATIARHLELPVWDRERLRNAREQASATCALLEISDAWCREQRAALVAEPSDASDEMPFELGATTSLGRLWIVLAGTPSGVLREFLLQLDSSRVGSLACALIAPTDFAAAVERPTEDGTQIGGNIDLAHLKELAEEGPVVELVNSMLSRAVSQRASDVHLEPTDSGFAIRLRVDGRMRQLERYNAIPYEAVVCRIKILSNMDIAERRLPQDGRLDARVNGISFDVRVSVIPMIKGASVVLRLLRQERVPSNLQDLGMSGADAALLHQWLSLPNGLILVTGPTGSGKSTTLYTAIDLLGKKTDKIVTVEDPVEYKLADVSQIQVNAEIGLDFPQALRSILRHDPDVILVGEIRDSLTAQIATQAALTGHLVLSTLHTNTAAGAVTRLLDMGVDTYLLADSLKGVMAQRLVRRLCDVCKQPAGTFPHALQVRLGKIALDNTPASATPMRPVGCPQCDQSGYDGRIGIYDLLPFDPDLSALIRPGVTARQLETAAHAAHGTVAWADGWHKVALGETTAEEITATTSEDAATTFTSP